MTVRPETTRADCLTARREEFLTVKEFAFLLGQHPKSVYRRVCEHRQPGVLRFGREIRIDLAACIEPGAPALVEEA